ncbi:MAG: TetR/AcrR family transcriptional regulator [Rhodospirillaceae bacterium]
MSTPSNGNPKRETKGVSGRQRILETAYDLFTHEGINKVGIDTVLAESGAAKMTLYRNFRTKEDLALAVLDLRQERWTFGWLRAEVLERTQDAHQRLLSIFDLFDEWFHQADFTGCPFIRALLESEPGSTIHAACGHHLRLIGDFVAELASDADIPDTAAFGRIWHILMKGAIVDAYGGNLKAAAEAKRAASVVLRHWTIPPAAKHAQRSGARPKKKAVIKRGRAASGNS